MSLRNSSLRRGVTVVLCVACVSLWSIGCATSGSCVGCGDSKTEKDMELPAINPEEAKGLLDSDSGYIYLDVRTQSEFQAGRPVGAINIPVAEINPASGGMELNDRFIDVVAAHIAKDAKVIVGCRTGSRSAAAQELMQQAGYTTTFNMLGGFLGKTDSTGQVLAEGWSSLGYPSERGDAGDAGYAALSSKVSQ